MFIYITYTCVREDQTLSRWIWNYSHFLNFLAAQEKENRPPTALPLRWMFLLSFVCEFTKPQQLRTSKLLWSFSVTATYPGTKTAVLHNKEQSWNEAAAVRWLSTSGRLLAAAASISQQGKIMLSCCPDKMTEAALITFPQGSVKFQLTSYLNLICTDVDRVRDKQVQTVQSQTDRSWRARRSTDEVFIYNNVQHRDRAVQTNSDHTFTSKSKAVFVGNVQLWLVRSLSWGNIFENKSWSNHAFMWCWINWKREFPTGENPHEHHLKVGTLTGKVWEIVVELLQSHIKTWRMKDNILLSARNVFNYWRKMLKTCLGSTIEMKFHELVFKLSRINTTK